MSCLLFAEEEKYVEVPRPLGVKSKYLGTHFYPDGSVQVQITEECLCHEFASRIPVSRRANFRNVRTAKDLNDVRRLVSIRPEWFFEVT
jgi:hypothetical protein